MLRAAAEGDAGTIKSLLAAGALVDACHPRTGQTPLIRAAFFGREEIVQLLLGAGANPGIKDTVGFTALDWANSRGFVRVTRLLESAATSPRSTSQPTAGTGSSMRATGAAPAPLTTPISLSNPGEETMIAKPPMIIGEEPDAELRFSEDRFAHTQPEQARTESSESRTEHFTVSSAIYRSIQTDRQAAARPAAVVPAVRKTQPITMPLPPSRSAKPLVWFGVSVVVLIVLVATVAGGYLLLRKRQAQQPVIVNSSPAAVPVNVNTPAGSTAVESRNQSIVEGQLKGSEVSLPQPEFPSSVSNTNGYVTVSVLVNRDGKVIQARAIKGPAALREPARIAALKAIFVQANRAERSGTITYLYGNDAAVGSPDLTIASRPNNSDANETRVKAFVEGPIRGSEIDVPAAVYPASAKALGIGGSITVAVTVNSQGKVTSTRASNGPQILRQAANAAASRALFRPQDGPVRTGSITYDFGKVTLKQS